MRNQGKTHHDVRGLNHAGYPCNHQHKQGREQTTHSKHGKRGRQQGIHQARKHKQAPIPHPISSYAKQGGDQRSCVLQGTENHQQHDRLRLDQYVPAKDEDLHLEGPGG